jgi:peptidoglycan-associated lipoprotein
MKTMTRALAAALMLAAAAGPAAAQIRFPRLPVIIPLGRSDQPPPAPAPLSPVMPGSLQAGLIAAAGSDTVYFSHKSANLDPNAVATLAAQARWLLANPMYRVRLEGHANALDSRDYALAIGDRRANEVRDYLVLQGVAPERISVMSWGKERPGTVRVGASVVAVGARVVTIVEQPAPVFPPPPPAG